MTSWIGPGISSTISSSGCLGELTSGRTGHNRPASLFRKATYLHGQLPTPSNETMPSYCKAMLTVLFAVAMLFADLAIAVDKADPNNLIAEIGDTKLKLSVPPGAGDAGITGAGADPASDGVVGSGGPQEAKSTKTKADAGNDTDGLSGVVIALIVVGCLVPILIGICCCFGGLALCTSLCSRTRTSGIVGSNYA